LSLVRFRAQNHAQQTSRRGPNPDVDDRSLPATDFAALQRRFAFTLDAAAASHNAKLPRFHSVEACGLKASWAGERVYCNPPYSDIRPWVQKAWAETGAELVVMLLPANRTEQGWWQDLIEPARDRRGSPLRVEFLPGRLRFLKRGQEVIRPNERPPFGSCLCIWRPKAKGRGRTRASVELF
jgi:phage N-6-adenine-methyltransferase